MIINIIITVPAIMITIFNNDIFCSYFYSVLLFHNAFVCD